MTKFKRITIPLVSSEFSESSQSIGYYCHIDITTQISSALGTSDTYITAFVESVFATSDSTYQNGFGSVVNKILGCNIKYLRDTTVRVIIMYK